MIQYRYLQPTEEGPIESFGVYNEDQIINARVIKAISEGQPFINVAIELAGTPMTQKIKIELNGQETEVLVQSPNQVILSHPADVSKFLKKHFNDEVRESLNTWVETIWNGNPETEPDTPELEELGQSVKSAKVRKLSDK